MKKVINYSGTGIKTLKNIALFILIIGLLATVISFVGCWKRDFLDSEFQFELLPGVLLILVATLLAYGICMAIATIAKNSIFIKEQLNALLEKEGIKFNLKEPQKPVNSLF
ncbi:MAG: hypothetical protein LBF04_00265 [Prevotellaceae bacterium]|jgi:MFS-type transporter involved in bile tolerance (Atg22 family)|nr:hypothetical protein [Prevotellaceae bacterium]